MMLYRNCLDAIDHFHVLIIFSIVFSFSQTPKKPVVVEHLLPVMDALLGSLLGKLPLKLAVAAFLLNYNSNNNNNNKI